MDNAVALVQAYLRVNGYFTVTEYSVVEAMKSGGFRTATDLDLLAFRLPGAGRRLTAGPGDRRARAHSFAPDPELGAAADESDMLIGEVKEGRTELNAGTRNRETLRFALARFGCCSLEDAPRFAEDLIARGSARLPSGHQARLVAFGSLGPESPPKNYRAISLGHVVRFLQAHLAEHWAVLRHAEMKDPAFGFLSTIQKALAGVKGTVLADPEV